MALIVRTIETDKSKWYEFEGGSQFLIRPLPGKKFRQIREQCTSVKFSFRQGRKEKDEDLDEDKFMELLSDYMLEDWKGLVTENGDGGLVPLPVTMENKKAVLDTPAIWEFVFHNAQGLEIVPDEEIKN